MLASFSSDRCMHRYPNLEIIVLDWQTPQIVRWVERRFSKVEVMHFKQDIGPLASYNNVSAVKANHKSKFIPFLDNDTIVEPY